MIQEQQQSSAVFLGPRVATTRANRTRARRSEKISSPIGLGRAEQWKPPEGDMRARLGGVAAAATIVLWSSSAFADAIVITSGLVTLSWDGGKAGFALVGAG